MLQKILGIITNRKSSWIMLFVLIITIIGIGMVRNYNKSIVNNKSAIYKEQKLKPIDEFTLKDNLSNYEKFMNEKRHGVDRKYNFDPRVKIVEGGGRPLRLLYREKKAEAKEQDKPQVESKKEDSIKVAPVKKKKQKKEEEIWSYSAVNPECLQEQNLFKAIVRETQLVYDGKPLKIVLLEPIPELFLEAGTILKGPATFSNSARIRIHITAAEGSRKKIDLDCFDSEDLQEGIYNDELARQLEEATKEGIVDELLDLDFQGKSIAKKAHNLTRIAKKITLEEGKEIYLAVTPKENDN